ncbi:unnamed protein product [Lepeophtheirus salmonis]|uniref:(salmon louse) hypothetical protein n=1 Tax=Lepeophtheirus salmonis TaxID=72036 RepID=A0A7R8CR13_LEPSM|nr:unnamed protein product [Lepeophtheirus salmonis]CAF2863382.1 unnamed protein product [Lepeophtheirus salmonis]
MYGIRVDIKENGGFVGLIVVFLGPTLVVGLEFFLSDTNLFPQIRLPSSSEPKRSMLSSSSSLEAAAAAGVPAHLDRYLVTLCDWRRCDDYQRANMMISSRSFITVDFFLMSQRSFRMERIRDIGAVVEEVH